MPAGLPSCYSFFKFLQINFFCCKKCLLFCIFFFVFGCKMLCSKKSGRCNILWRYFYILFLPINVCMRMRLSVCVRENWKYLFSFSFHFILLPSLRRPGTFVCEIMRKFCFQNTKQKENYLNVCVCMFVCKFLWAFPFSWSLKFIFKSTSKSTRIKEKINWCTPLFSLFLHIELLPNSLSRLLNYAKF